MEELQHCEILKTNINVTNMSDTIKYIGGHLDDLRGKYICVSNVHTTVMSYENEEYRKIQNWVPPWHCLMELLYQVTVGEMDISRH